MKTNDELENQLQCERLDKMRVLYDASDELYSVIDFVEACITDIKLKYLPNDISIDANANRVMLIYEENDGDYLTVTFKGDDTSEEDIIISYSYYTNDTIVDEKNKHWKDALKVINSWKDQ